MNSYQPAVNPNDVLEGTIQRGRNGLYWISQPISSRDNIHSWILYDGVPDNIELPQSTSVENRLPRTTALENLLNELDSTDIPNIPDTRPRLSRTNALENLLNELDSRDTPDTSQSQMSRSLTHSPASYDLPSSNDDEDFRGISDSTRAYPRTVRSNSVMSFSTDSINNNSIFDYNNTESNTESNYDEDSNIYTNVSSNSDSIIDGNSELLSKCLNDSPVTLSNYDETDLNEIFVIYLPNQQGKFIKGSCLRRDEMKDVLKSDLHTIPSYIMSIYKTPSSNRSDDLLTGMTGKPTGKIIVRIPTNQIYVTFGSLKRVLSTPNKEWYALPLYGGKSRRLGNLAGIYGSSMNHGQVPGFKIYKLFTKHDIENSIISQETSDDFPHVYQYDTMKSLFELVGDTPVNIFIHNILDELINTQIITLPNIPQRTSSLQLTSKRQRRYGNPPDEL